MPLIEPYPAMTPNVAAIQALAVISSLLAIFSFQCSNPIFSHRRIQAVQAPLHFFEVRGKRLDSSLESLDFGLPVEQRVTL